MTVTSADEFYSIMGVLTREMLEFTDTNNLIKVSIIVKTITFLYDNATDQSTRATFNFSCFRDRSLSSILHRSLYRFDIMDK